MPIYEYQCDSCGSQREIIVKHGEEARPTCTACRKRMRRVISKTAFILKGSGWYVTDYPSDARKKGMAGEKPAAAAAGEKKESTTAEKKPAAGEKKESASGEKKPAAAEKKTASPSPATGRGGEAKKRK